MADTDTSLIPRNRYHPIATKALQQAALTALEQHGTICDAARAIGVDPHTISRWCKKSEAYAAKVKQAMAFADTYHTLDAIRSNFKQRALAGKDDGQSAIIGMFLAKKIDPSYRDNAATVNVQVGPVAIQFNLQAVPQAEPQADTDNNVTG